MRSQHDLSVFALYLFLSSVAHILLAALNLAISSKKSSCTLKKKLNCGAKSSIFSPLFRADSIYSKPLASVNAASCAAVEPASRIWYPLMLTGFHLGTSVDANSIVSITSLIDWSIGKINSF